METPRWRWFWAIRLRTVMMLVVIVALAIGYLLQTRRVAQLNQQLAVLQRDQARSQYAATRALIQALAVVEEQRSEAPRAETKAAAR